jgi:rubrerythrin
MTVQTHDLLDYAIDKEQEAHDFYVELAGKMQRSEIRRVFNDFALEELRHKSKLQGIKAHRNAVKLAESITDLKIGDYLVDVELNPELDYQQALILAMKREKAAFRLYYDLAARAVDTDLKTILLALAQEEAKHKLRFEIEYDEHYLTEN